MPAINIVLSETYPGTLTIIPGGQTIDTNIGETYQAELEILQNGTTLSTILGPVIRGEQGPPGNQGLEIPFAWGDATPKLLLLGTAGKLVYNVQLHIDVAFNGVNATLEVGDLIDPDRLMRADQNAPSEAGSYSVSPNYRYVSDTNIYLTITPGVGASTGSGLLTLFIEQ